MKGNSQRVPGKNLKNIAGRPLFHWILDTLLSARRVDEVMVDTDSDDIEEAVVATFSDVTIHRRPVEWHGDEVPMHDIVTDVAGDTDQEHILQCRSTNPLLAPSTVDRAIARYLEPGDHDSLMSVTPLQSRFYFMDGRPVNHDPSVLVRTQDLDPIYEENSNIYIAPVNQIRQTGLRIGKSPFLFPIDAAEAVDIDVELDFRIAEFLLEDRRA